MGLAEGALSLLFYPFVEARQVVVVHAFDLGDFLAVLHLVEADRAILLT
jgi:hypothetical protein